MLYLRSTSDGFECRDYHKLKPNSTCDFIKFVDDCKFEDSLFNYLELTFCTFDEKKTWIPITLLVLWLIFLFIALGITSDAFFCPSLQVISKLLGLSENLAGVTLLAFGNGAPDLFSAIAAISNVKDGDAGLAVGAILGAGLFVSLVVPGTISLVSPFKSMERPLLRDLIFFIASAYWLFLIVWNAKIGLLETLGFIVMYILYILSVISGRFLNLKFSKQDEKKLSQKEVAVELKETSETKSNANEEHNEKYSRLDDVIKALRPFSFDELREAGIIGKIMLIIKIPIILMLKLSTPLVDEEAENNNWNKCLIMINFLIAPTFVAFAADLAFVKIDDFMPVWVLTLASSVILFITTLVFTKWQKKPKNHQLVSWLGFIVSVMWIYKLANEIVNLLTVFGILFNISNTILGLTFLAWGNSLPDFVSNVVSARQGQAKMGISACYGGSVFNILLGIGIPFTIACSKSGTLIMKKSFLQDVLCLFLGIGLMATLIFIPFNKFQFTRRFGLFLILLYFIAILISVLIETGIIS